MLQKPSQNTLVLYSKMSFQLHTEFNFQELLENSNNDETYEGFCYDVESLLTSIPVQ